MSDSFISQRHTLHQKFATEWPFLMDSFSGGADYLNTDYLFMHSREKEVDFANRKKRAYYLNYCEKSVEIPISFVYQTDIKRDAKNADVETFLHDADLKGTAFSTFMQEQVAIPAGVYSHVLVVVDMPGEASASPSRLASVEANYHPYVSVYAPQDVVNWNMDTDGRFLWVRVREDAPDETGPFDTRGKQRSVYRTWTREAWFLTDDKGVQIATEEHGLGEVPALFARTKDNKRYPTIGKSMLTDIAYVNRSIFNKCSLVDEFSYGQAFPFLAVPIGEKQANVDIVAKKLKEVGSKSAMAYDGGTDPPTYVSPQVETAAFLVSEVESLSRKIAEIAKMQDFSAKETNASGVAKAYDFHDQNASLAKIASNLEDAERKILRLVHKWSTSGANEPDDTDILVEYPDDFNVKAMNEEIDEAIALQTMQISATFDATLKKHVVSRVFPDMDAALRKKIDDEIDNPPEPVAPLPPDDDDDPDTADE